jgi:dolichyl-diphosphooligosaccharide--protein glycosyltransferase
MLEHGVWEFFDWFDTMSWYPIGRHVGSTTFPGLQITSVFLYHFLEFIGFPMSINDICVFVPAVFGSLCTFFTYLLTTEVSRSPNAGVAAALIMSILPAHLMRSVAGGYDNEAIALTAIVSTFYFWCRSIRTPSSWYLFAPLTALSYIYMVAAWGGYTFVLNMIGLHAGFLVAIGRYSHWLHASYSVFYIFGTAGAIQFPIVGWLPLKSMEQVMPLMVFVGLQFFRFMYFWKEKNNMTPKEFQAFQVRFIGLCGAVGAVVFGYLFFSGWLGPFSNRIRSLFIPHTRTGNPLVDSVSEHQATSPSYYWQYFHYVYYIAPFGFFLLFNRMTDAKIFGILFCLLSYYFSHKMVRLLLILSPSAAMVAGMLVWLVVKWSLQQITGQASQDSSSASPKATPKKGAQSPALEIPDGLRTLFPLIAIVCLISVGMAGYHYYEHCDMMAHQMSHPQILVQGRNHKGETVIIDDFMQSYWWLRDHTPPDARVMAWWDYGYQINGVANRTTIADGNTWNHEHIALLGKALVSPEKKAWRIARHLADYVLVWTTRFAGMYGDDLAKMPHIGNIAGSVYKDVPRTGYTMDEKGRPSELMRQSLLYKLSVAGLVPGAEPLTYFKEAYTSPNKMVRIYKVLNVAPRHPFGTYDPKLELGIFEE